MMPLSLAKKPILLLVWVLALVPQNDAAKKTKKIRLLPIGPNQGVTFNHVEFMAGTMEKGSSESPVLTDWGDFIVNQTEVTKLVGSKKGYINVFLRGKEWVIDNMRVNTKLPKRHREPPILKGEIPPPKSPASISTFFALGTQGKGSVAATVIFTKQPLKDTMKNRNRVKGIPAQSFALGTTKLNFGGADEEGDKPFTAESIGTLMKPKQRTGRGPNNYWVEQNPSWTFNVDAAKNQCVPMAYANMLRYLKAVTDLRVNEPHAPGYAPDHTLVGTLDTLMGRYVVGWDEGGGVKKSEAMHGLMKYLLSQEEDVKIRHYGGRPLYKISETMKSIRVTKYPRFDKVCKEVKNDYGVTMRFGRYNPRTGKRTGGHALRIVACGVINGVQKIRAIDDSEQGSGQRRRLSDLDTGLREREYVLSHLDSDGMLNFNNNENQEFEFVVVVEFSPSSGGTNA